MGSVFHPNTQFIVLALIGFGLREMREAQFFTRVFGQQLDADLGHGDVDGVCEMTAPDAAAELAERRPALVLSSLLLVAGVLAGLSPIAGIARAADGSPTSASVFAAFVVALPGVLAVVLALRRPSTYTPLTISTKATNHAFSVTNTKPAIAAKPSAT